MNLPRPRCLICRRRAWLGVLVLLGTALTAPAALLERDLGEGLRLVRAHTLPAELPPASAKSAPLVLDLRYTTAQDGAATALDAWLRFRATPKTPVIVLLNTDTAPALRNALSDLRSHPGLLQIGSGTGDLATDLRIATSPEDERRAYVALEAESSVAALTTENPDKPRFDEAAVMRELTNPPPPLEPDAVSELTPDDAPKPPAPPPPLIDRPLQRAIQIHRALLALKRL